MQREFCSSLLAAVSVAALFSMTVMSAVISFSMMVMAADSIRIIIQTAFQECFNLCVCISAGSRIKTDSGLSQSISGASADSSADQYFCSHILQKSCQGTMSLSIGIHDLRGNNFPLFCFIDLKMLRMTEMLKNLSLVISYRYFHFVSSSHASAAGLSLILDAVVPALYPKRCSFNEKSRCFFPGFCIHGLNSRSSHPHFCSTRFLVLPQIVYKPQCFILFY